MPRRHAVRHAHRSAAPFRLGLPQTTFHGACLHRFCESRRCSHSLSNLVETGQGEEHLQLVFILADAPLSLTSAPSSRNRASVSHHGRPPLTGRAKINSRVRWCLRFIKPWCHTPVVVAADAHASPQAANAAPEWQARSYSNRSRLAGGLSTLGACSKVSLLNRQRP